MKRYLIFITVLGLGLGACKNDLVTTPDPEQELELRVSKKADLNTPQPVILFAERVEKCADTYLKSVIANGDTPDIRSKFKACLSSINTPVPTGPTNDPYPPAGVPAAHEPAANYNSSKTFQELVKFAGIISPTTTQDSVDRFVDAYQSVDLIVRNSGPGIINLDLNKQLDYAIKNNLGGYVITIAGSIAFPNAGMAYLLSINNETFSIPVHWLDYGCTLRAPYQLPL